MQADSSSVLSLLFVCALFPDLVQPYICFLVCLHVVVSRQVCFCLRLQRPVSFSSEILCLHHDDYPFLPPFNSVLISLAMLFWLHLVCANVLTLSGEVVTFFSQPLGSFGSHKRKHDSLRSL